MNQNIYIYLAGNIKKGKEDEEELVWTEEDRQILQHHLPQFKLIFLNPASRSDDLSDQKSVFGRDLFQVHSSNIVLVDARGKRGLGVGAEMMFAKMHGIPVISWLPEQSHYQRESIHLLGQYVESWIHPFVYNLSDFLATDLETAARWISESLAQGKVKIKDAKSIQDCMQYYLTTQLSDDQGMQTIVTKHEHFIHKLTLLDELATT